MLPSIKFGRFIYKFAIDFATEFKGPRLVCLGHKRSSINKGFETILLLMSFLFQTHTLPLIKNNLKFYRKREIYTINCIILLWCMSCKEQRSRKKHWMPSLVPQTPQSFAAIINSRRSLTDLWMKMGHLACFQVFTIVWSLSLLNWTDF